MALCMVGQQFVPAASSAPNGQSDELCPHTGRRNGRSLYLRQTDVSPDLHYCRLPPVHIGPGVISDHPPLGLREALGATGDQHLGTSSPNWFGASNCSWRRDHRSLCHRMRRCYPGRQVVLLPARAKRSRAVVAAVSYPGWQAKSKKARCGLTSTYGNRFVSSSASSHFPESHRVTNCHSLF